MGGLQRTWDRIKAYLTTWKTTNFGSGTYSNSGSITVQTEITIGNDVTAWDDLVKISNSFQLKAVHLMINSFKISTYTGMVIVRGMPGVPITIELDENNVWSSFSKSIVFFYIVSGGTIKWESIQLGMGINSGTFSQSSAGAIGLIFW